MISRRNLGIVLWPLSLMFRVVVTIRNFLFDVGVLKSEKFEIATIAVGNITVGGTGKTPHIEYLVKLLSGNFSLAVLSRGYRRKTKGYLEAELTSTALDIGDEPRQIKNKFPHVSVVVDADRRAGIRRIISNGDESHNPSHVVLLDDAYQHRYVNPGLSILLIDYNRPIDEDRMLPVGNLREPEGSKHRANFIIISKCPESLKPIDCRLLTHRFKVYPHQKLFFTTLRYSNPVNVFNRDVKIEVNELSDTSLLVVSGIAEPKLLIDHLEGLAKDVEILSYEDHHYFSASDVERIGLQYESIENTKKIILTTEKDATRMLELDLFREQFGEFLYYIPVEVEFLYDGKEQFDEKILNYVKRNKRNSRLLKK